MAPGTDLPPRPLSPLRATRKRKRIVISCTECHRRKQKCDRQSPCANCVARGKQSLCHYENEYARKQQLLEESANSRNEAGGLFSVIKPESDSAAQVSALGYASSNDKHNTILEIFKKIETQDGDASSVISSPSTCVADHSGLKEKYKSLIRQLPSKPYIEKLVAAFFREVNYQYDPLDEGIFRDLLKSWHNLSFSTLNKGPLELPAELQFFPALLFQMLALALLFQPMEYDPGLDSLKYAAGMSFDDLASDYSESGLAILNLLGKRHTTLVTVQAGFLRTAYLKYCGMVAESWHSLSQTIRDAQEINLHREVKHKPLPKREDNQGDANNDLWHEQLRQRMWVILSLWDIYYAMALGRPTTIDPRDGRPFLPIDVRLPMNRREEAPIARTESDMPTPLSMLLLTTETAVPLWETFNLEREDPHHTNFGRVEKLHILIKETASRCPPCFRGENPDTRWDNHPDCAWLPRCRPLVASNLAFIVMCLHRPYIFTSVTSRTVALKACLDVLRYQRKYFNNLNSKHYKMFAIVLNTFDAVVLAAAIYILYPKDYPDDLEPTLQHFEWAMERFQIISSRNTLAKAALGVLKAILVRLKRALDRQAPPGHGLPPCSTGSTSGANPMYSERSEQHYFASTSTAISGANGSTHASISTPMSPYPRTKLHSSISAESTSSDSASHSSSNGSHPSLLSSTSSASTQYTQPTISNLTEATPSPSPVSHAPPPSYPQSHAVSQPPPPSTYSHHSQAVAQSQPASYPQHHNIQPDHHNHPPQVPTQSNAQWDAYAPPLSGNMPQQYDYSGLAPLMPMHDLLFNDLGTSGLGSGLDGLPTSDYTGRQMNEQPGVGVSILMGCGGAVDYANGNGNGIIDRNDNGAGQTISYANENSNGMLDSRRPIAEIGGGVGGVLGNLGTWGTLNALRSADQVFQFEGDFRSDSFWGFMNTYVP